MDALLYHLSDAILAIRDETTLKKTLSDVTRDFGFHAYAYLSVLTNWVVAVSNYPSDWQTAYFQHGYDKLDPIVITAKTGMKAFVWSSDVGRKQAPEIVRRFWDEAAEFDIRSGVTIPVRTSFGHMAMLTFASKHPGMVSKRGIDAVTAAAVVGQLHGRVETLNVQPTSEKRLNLRPKEINYLHWAAEGKSMEEIADIQGVKYNSVKINIENAKKRSGTRNLIQLVSLAIRQGVI